MTSSISTSKSPIGSGEVLAADSTEAPGISTSAQERFSSSGRYVARVTENETALAISDSSTDNDRGIPAGIPGADCSPGGLTCKHQQRSRCWVLYLVQNEANSLARLSHVSEDQFTRMKRVSGWTNE